MPTRRDFLAAASAAVGVPGQQSEPGPSRAGRKTMAIVTTVWWEHSHAWHMGERFLAGYPINGKWHKPQFEVVSAYVDQCPANDLSRARAKEFGFTIYPTIAQALRRGGDRLAVDAVLVIGEHGRYPQTAFGQKQYPRYEFFQQVVEVFKKDGRTTPVFNDKHLSWKWEWAKEMVETSRAMPFPLLAGSSLPHTWRLPAIELPLGADVEEVMCVAMGGVDGYDFHALETIQCMVERRRGGETGVAAVQGMRGQAVWQAMQFGSWPNGGWDPQLWEACLARSQTLAQARTFSHRYPSVEQIRNWVKNPVAYRIDYADGLKATMLLMNGLVGDFTFAARLKSQPEPLSTLFYLPPDPNVVYSAALMSQVEEMFLTGNSPFAVERTLLTTGLVAACVESLANGQKRLPTPHLAIRYQAPRESAYWRT
jgi:hypothetical protein